MTTFRFIDLFAGIGGLRAGFDRIGGECVFTSEWNKFSQKTYAENFEDGENHVINGDITQVKEEDIPSHDVLLAGFPCQPFSISGVSKRNSLGRAHGFSDLTQGTLFFDVVRILRHHKPSAFLLENVKNLVSHDKGNTFKVITQTLDELGYEVSYRVISAKHWVPQNRERIFIAGFRKDLGMRFNFDDVIIPGAPHPVMRDILHPEDGSEMPEPPFTDPETGEVNPKYTLSPKLWQYLQDYAAKHKAAGNGFGFGLCGPESVARTLSARYGKDGSEILVEQSGHRPRRLTPRECARIMGFDRRGSNEPWKIPVSDAQAYRQFGNAVAPPVSNAIAEAMSVPLFAALEKSEDKIF